MEQSELGEEGLYILEAYYGCIPVHINFKTNIKKVVNKTSKMKATGPILDVKLPLEIMIEDSSIIYNNCIVFSQISIRQLSQLIFVKIIWVF